MRKIDNRTEEERKISEKLTNFRVEFQPEYWSEMDLLLNEQEAKKKSFFTRWFRIGTFASLLFLGTLGGGYWVYDASQTKIFSGIVAPKTLKEKRAAERTLNSIEEQEKESHQIETKSSKIKTAVIPQLLLNKEQAFILPKERLTELEPILVKDKLTETNPNKINTVNTVPQTPNDNTESQTTTEKRDREILPTISSKFVSVPVLAEKIAFENQWQYANKPAMKNFLKIPKALKLGFKTSVGVNVLKKNTVNTTGENYQSPFAIADRMTFAPNIGATAQYLFDARWSLQMEANHKIVNGNDTEIAENTVYQAETVNREAIEITAKPVTNITSFKRLYTIETPVLVGYTFRNNRSKIFVGPQLSYIWAAQKEVYSYEKGVSRGTLLKTSLMTTTPDYFNVINLGLAAGYQQRLNKNLFLDIRYNQGLTNTLRQNIISNTPNKRKYNSDFHVGIQYNF